MTNPHIRSLFSRAVPPELQGQTFGLMSALESVATALTPWVVNQVCLEVSHIAARIHARTHMQPSLPIPCLNRGASQISPRATQTPSYLPLPSVFAPLSHEPQPPRQRPRQIYAGSPSGFPGMVWLVQAGFLVLANFSLWVAWREASRAAAGAVSSGVDLSANLLRGGARGGSSGGSNGSGSSPGPGPQGATRV
jgi:hypothetical protein